MDSTNTGLTTSGSPRVHGEGGTDTGRPRISIVTTVYSSQATIAEFLKRALAAAAPFTSDLEIVVVNDGSPDRSADIVKDVARRDSRVALVTLSRNFGHHKALLTGLELAQGDLVFLVDSDLEEEPEHLSNMLSIMNKSGADVVYGAQPQRKGNTLERLSGWLFYQIFNRLSEVEMPRNVSTMRLMTRRYVNSFLRFRDRNPVFVPLSILAGYPQVEYCFSKKSSSETTYSFARRFSLLLLAVTSFTAKPLALMFWLSLALSTVGFLFGFFVVLRALFGQVQDGWSSLMAGIVFFFSLNALFTGIIGLYLKVIMDELKERPRTVIQEIFRKEP